MAQKKMRWDLITLILIILVIPLLLSDSFYLDTVNLVGIYAIGVIGLNLILGVGGLITLGHAAFFGLGAYLSSYISIHLQLNPFLSILISCILVALITFIISFPILRLSGYFLALGTLAIGVVFYTLINGGGTLTGGPNGITGMPGFSIGGYEFTSYTQLFYLIWITVFIVYILSKNLMDSKEGRALKAIHSDEEAAATFGINIFKLKVKMFVVGCTLGALGGGFYAHYMLFISPDILSLHSSINFIMMGFLGGLGSYLGPIFGSFIFQVIRELAHMAGEYESLIHGVIFLIVVVFFSGGIQQLSNKIRSLSNSKRVTKDNVKNTNNIQKSG
ncbi:branched-chain amino acid ABC transporter permease [Bacillus sp. Marseille-P3661]|uniref:branched-chain amino acid ABC transporter permease n=1 Tax=Bacillus sp. Marseille-P3661 TaxID=1936234 RepID=UPI000C85BF55|nr:branched-chain amino acid ABC transporter permease [Bacillus sp. Marseille-P3661]